MTSELNICVHLTVSKVLAYSKSSVIKMLEPQHKDTNTFQNCQHELLDHHHDLGAFYHSLLAKENSCTALVTPPNVTERFFHDQLPWCTLNKKCCQAKIITLWLDAQTWFLMTKCSLGLVCARKIRQRSRAHLIV